MAVSRGELEDRFKAFAVRVVHLSRALPNDVAGRAIGSQLLRSGTSAAANYRAAGRGRSRAEFAAKLGIAVEEADESVFWLEVIEESGLLSAKQVGDLLSEARELTAIVTRARRTARTSVEKSPPQH